MAYAGWRGLLKKMRNNRWPMMFKPHRRGDVAETGMISVPPVDFGLGDPRHHV